MNREVYEANDKYATVIEDNGMIRILSKEEDKNTKFEDLFQIEDKIEHYRNEVERIEGIIDNISVPDVFIDNFFLSVGTGIVAGLLLGLGAYSGATVTQTSENVLSILGSPTVIYPALLGFGCGTLTTMFQAIKDTIAAYRRKKSLKETVKDVNKYVEHFTKEKEKISQNIKLEKRVALPIMQNEDAYQVARIISNNERSARQVEIDNLERLRNEMTKYLDENGIKEESSRQYSINKRYRDR